MKCVEATGKTVDEAIESALLEMDLSIEDVEYLILEEGSKGLFGIFGSRPAKVRVTEKDTPVRRARNFLSQLLEKMGVNADIIIKEEDNLLNIGLKGKYMGIVIGHRGETLDALQYLTSLVVNKGTDKYKRVIIDTENYRKKREETLVKLAKRLAAKAKRTGRRVVLEPMNPYERRILHSTLQNHPYVQTHSEGEDPNRRVVITLK
ncbi:MAG: RNA-binding cell elongation regulator Jag/EloR [Clostridia bacterium]